MAYWLDTGEEKWKGAGRAADPAYASPVLLTLDGVKVVVVVTVARVAALNIADGRLLWETPFQSGASYNASSPVADGRAVLCSGPGLGSRAVAFDWKDRSLTAKSLWTNKEVVCQYSTPVVKGRRVYGLSDRDEWFCLAADTGKTVWTEPAPRVVGTSGAKAVRGYGSVVDAGSVLLGLTPAGKLVVFRPTDRGFEEVARYAVADGGTFAYPVVSGNRVFIKDAYAVALWAVE